MARCRMFGRVVRQKVTHGRYHSEFEELPRPSGPSEEPDSDRTGSRRRCCEPAACSSLLGHWERDSDPPEERRLGGAGHRAAGEGPPLAVSRHAGLSPRNLKDMRAFAEAWPEDSIVQVPLAQLTWYLATSIPSISRISPADA